MQDNEARLNITWQGANGELPDPVLADSTDADVRAWATEAVRSGSVPGVPADAGVDFRDFVVDRFGPTEARPYALLMIRPKTPFGGTDGLLDDLLDGKPAMIVDSPQLRRALRRRAAERTIEAKNDLDDVRREAAMRAARTA